MNIINLNGPMAQGNNLKKIIKQKGTTLREVADTLGVRPETVSRHCTGYNRMTIEDATRYAEHLGVSPEAIYVEQIPLDIIGHLQEVNVVQMYPSNEMPTMS